MVSLLAILVGGAGLFTVLSKFNVPELNVAFYGQNPFAVKHDVIDGVITWVFTLMAVTGLVLQAGAEIAGDRLPDRRHRKPAFYLRFFAVGVVAMVAIVWLLTAASYRVAKSYWWPEIIVLQREAFKAAEFVVQNQGWREDQLPIKERLQDAEKHRQANLDQAKERINQIERLLELEPLSEDLRARIVRLQPFFAQ